MKNKFNKIYKQIINEWFMYRDKGENGEPTDEYFADKDMELSRKYQSRSLGKRFGNGPVSHSEAFKNRHPLNQTRMEAYKILRQLLSEADPNMSPEKKEAFIKQTWNGFGEYILMDVEDGISVKDSLNEKFDLIYHKYQTHEWPFENLISEWFMYRNKGENGEPTDEYFDDKEMELSRKYQSRSMKNGFATNMNRQNESFNQTRMEAIRVLKQLLSEVDPNMSPVEKENFIRKAWDGYGEYVLSDVEDGKSVKESLDEQFDLIYHKYQTHKFPFD